MRSRFEERFAADLDRRGIHYEYETVKMPYVVVRRYTPDWIIGPIFIETKGYFLASDRTKLLAVRLANPGIDLRLVFQRAANTLSKTSKTTYGEWATKHGFLWAEGTLPDGWLV